MSNHFHLSLETPEPTLSAAMQWLNVSYNNAVAQALTRFGKRLEQQPELRQQLQRILDQL